MIIGIIPVRNEEWILRQNLQVLSHVCDIIIVGDHDSTDSTTEICANFPKVRVIKDNRSGTFSSNETNRRQCLLDAAREYDGNNIILALDADEILTATVFKNKEWLECLNSLAPGDSIELQWIWLWQSPSKYVERQSIWADRWTQFVFHDDRHTNYNLGNQHEPRVPQVLWTNARRFEGVKVMHYARMAPRRVQSRTCYYMVLELLQERDSMSINQQYIITRENQPMILEQVPDSWVRPWVDIGVDLQHFDDPELNWFDLEILRLFAQHSVERFDALNIWNMDWERKRQLALAQGYDELYSQPIIDPRNLEQKLYHTYLNRYISTPPWRCGRKDVAMSLWRMAQRLGVQRVHLERLGILKPHAQAPGNIGAMR